MIAVNLVACCLLSIFGFILKERGGQIGVWRSWLSYDVQSDRTIPLFHAHGGTWSSFYRFGIFTDCAL